ncbi:MAG: hypothetical protein AAFV98_21545 [Chloroflexota bacterium]
MAHVVGMILVYILTFQLAVWMPVATPSRGFAFLISYGSSPTAWLWYIASTIPILLLFGLQALFLHFQLRHMFHFKRWMIHCVGAWVLAVIIVFSIVESSYTEATNLFDSDWTFTGTNLYPPHFILVVD